MENTEITLEKIELVKDRTGTSYKEAKEALEAANGSVVDAIVAIEDTIDAGSEEKKDRTTAANDALEKIKEFIRKGNVSKISIKRNGETVVNIPVNVGIIGTVIFPWAAVASVIAAFGTKCEIEIVKVDGEVIDISGKANDTFDTVKSKGGVIFGEAADKTREIYNNVVEKGGEYMDAAKEKGGEFFDYAKDKGEDIINFAKDKAEGFTGKVEETAEKVAKSDEFDLSDLDLSDMEEKNE